MSRHVPRVILASIVFWGAHPGAVFAAPAEEADSNVLEQIVVTAQKREERLQDTPLTIEAFTGSMLASQRIETTQDLQINVPTLVYTSIAGYAQPYLRGIGNDVTSPNLDPSIATYVDGVYVSSNTAAIQNLLGTERVEVLSGPQGTLYGRNAVGGAINIYTLTPSQKVEAQATATVGDFNRREFAASVSGPITDTLSAGVYGAWIKRDTYLNLIQTGNLNGQPRDENGYGMRLKAVFTPIEAIKLTGSFELTDYESIEGSAFRQVQSNALGYASGAPLIIRPYTVTGNNAFYADTTSNAATLREEVDFGLFRFLGISGYRYSTARTQNDFDGTLADIGNSGEDPVFSKQLSQEMQLLSEPSSAIQWIAGVYYFSEKTAFWPNLTHSPVFFTSLGADEENVFSGVTLHSLSGFAQATAPLAFISPDLKLTLGGRYTQDKKNFNAHEQFLVSGPDRLYEGQVVLDVPVPPDNHKWSKFTPKATLDYKWDSTLFYASYSKGFKAGAYNLASPGSPGPVGPETLISYEIGIKSEFLGGAMRVNLTGYHYQMKDLQVETVLLNNGTSGGSISLQNAGSATASGVEVNASAKVARYLTLNLSGAYEHSRYGVFPDYAGYSQAAVGNSQGPVDVTGNSLQRAPDWVASMSANYDAPLFGGEAHAAASWYYNGGFAYDAAHFYNQPQYQTVNASIGYTIPHVALTATVWVTNVFDKYYTMGAVPLAFGTIVADAPPRMIGGTLNYKF